MEEEDGGRRCARCDRHIYDFSQLTEAQATEVKRLSGGSVCRKVFLDEDGAPIYAQRAVRAVVRTAAGVVLSVALAACDAEPAPASPRPATSSHEVHEALHEAAPSPDEEEPMVPMEAEVQPEVPPEVEAEVEPEVEPEVRAAPPSPRPRRHRVRRPPSHDEDPLVGLEGI